MRSENWAAFGRPFFLTAPSAANSSPMIYFAIKAGLSGLIVAAVSEVARRFPGWGGLIASLPLVSILAMIWLYRDSGDTEKVAALSSSALWFFIPSVPMFVAIPLLLRAGVGFWPTMAIAISGTLALYAGFFWIASRLGMQL
jgi:hypothetical protein